MDQKLKMVHEYLDDKVSTLKLSKKYGYDLSKIKYMIKLRQMVWQNARVGLSRFRNAWTKHREETCN